METRADYLAQEVRRHDPERFLCAMFVPAERRRSVLALLLLNQELAKVPDVASEPMAGMIRYQWWRDAIAEAATGTPRAHPVVQELAPILREGVLDPDQLTKLVDARELELDGLEPQDLNALEQHAGKTAGAVQVAILRLLGCGDEALAGRAAQCGTAFALVGYVRALGHHLRQGRVPLPRDLLDGLAIGSEAILEAGQSDRLVPVVRAMTERAEALVRDARGGGRLPRASLAAFLPGRLALSHARRIRKHAFDPFRPELEGPLPLAVLTLLRATITRSI